MHRPLVTIERTKYYLSGVDPSGRFGVEGDAVEDGLEVFGEEFAKEGDFVGVATGHVALGRL